jgi:hypothetical protein
MSAERARLLSLAGKVSDGKTVDWEEAESHSGGLRELRLIRRLRLVSSIASTNRRRPRHGTDEDPEKS